MKNKKNRKKRVEQNQGDFEVGFIGFHSPPADQ